MQRFLAKYGLAAHLAIVAVAPLFLFPFCTPRQTALALLWLTLFAAAWAVFNPSTRSGEPLHAARRRVASALAHDPFLYLSLVLVAFAGLRALNGGVRMAYDAEKGDWSLAQAAVAFFPGCADGEGLLPFAAVLALSVVALSVRQALGRSARMATLYISAALAGAASVVALAASHFGWVSGDALLAFPSPSASFAGLAFGLHFLSATAALATAFERRWGRALLAAPLAVGCTAAGAFAFAPPAMSAVFAVAGLLVLGFAFVYAHATLRSPGEYRLLAVFAISLAVGVVAVIFLMPEGALMARADAYVARAFVPDGFLELRRTLSDVAQRAWRSSPWVGTGLGAFAVDVRFNALPDEWDVIPPGAAAVANGGWLALAERGIAGVALLALPFCFLLFTYAMRLAAWAKAPRIPHPATVLAPLFVAVLALDVPFDASFMRPDALLAAGAAIAASAKAFTASEIKNV